MILATCLLHTLGEVRVLFTVNANLHLSPQILFDIAAFVPATADLGVAAGIDEMDAPAPRTGWSFSAFRLRAGDEEKRMVVAFPTGEAQPDAANWPQPCIDELRVCAE